MKVVRNDPVADRRLRRLAIGDAFEFLNAVDPHKVYIRLQQEPGQDLYYCLIPKTGQIVINSGHLVVRLLRAELRIFD